MSNSWQPELPIHPRMLLFFLLFFVLLCLQLICGQMALPAATKSACTSFMVWVQLTHASQLLNDVMIWSELWFAKIEIIWLIRCDITAAIDCWCYLEGCFQGSALLTVSIYGAEWNTTCHEGLHGYILVSAVTCFEFALIEAWAHPAAPVNNTGYAC